MINRCLRMREDSRRLGLEAVSMKKEKKERGIKRKRKISREDSMKNLGR